MNEIFTANLAALQERFPQATDLIRNAEEPKERRAFTNERGIVVYQAENHGHWLNLNSAYAPWAEAERQTERLSLDTAKLVFVIGEAGFYHLESILARIKKSEDTLTRLLFVSKQPDYLRLILASRDLRLLLEDEHFFLILDWSWEKLKGIMQQLVVADIYDIPTFSWFVHPVEEKLQEEFCLEFQSFLHFLYSVCLTNHNTVGLFEHWWLHNFICNIPHLLKAISNECLEESWKGKPVIVVGAGPSLNKNIEQLAEAMGRALILCVDTAYRSLVQRGITPDMIVTLDGSPMNAEHMRDMEYGDIPLLFDIYSHRDILRQHAWNTPKIVLSSHEYHMAWWNQIAGSQKNYHSLETGGSVATGALSFARHIGADPVILVGVDLSYPNGDCYAQGTLHDGKTLDEIRKGRQLIPVKDIKGNTVMTTYDYNFYLRWLHNKAKEKDRKYINATEGGAVREGFIIKALRDVLAEECREILPVGEWKANLISNRVDMGTMELIRNNLHRSYTEMKAASRFFKIMTISVEEHLKALDEEDYSRTELVVRRLSRAQLRLSNLSLAMAFLDAHSFKTVYTDVRLTDSIQRNRDRHTEKEKLKLAARQTYNLVSGFRNLAEVSLQMHRDALENIKLILKEMTGFEHSESL